jgi:hypothetical protein
VYTNFFYLISPVNVNGVSSLTPGVAPNQVWVATTNDVNSVPDNYTLRAGGNYTFDRLVFTSGIRYEGAPAYDLFGKRRAAQSGYIFRGTRNEYKFKSSFLYTFVTIPLSRNHSDSS